ncbi:MAG: hypothetical protein IPO01_17755 [Chitinophagaceae bacterium]|nr:hypothetical protein [Chitinophagaceae bacterium]
MPETLTKAAKKLLAATFHSIRFSILSNLKGILINYSVKARICTLLEEYNYSLAKFYEYGIDDFGMLLHYKG